MFQFPALAPLGDTEVPGFPIRKSSDHRVLARSPRLIAGSYVLHRLLPPRHPPRALCSLFHLVCARSRFFHSRTPEGAHERSTQRLPHPYSQCKRTNLTDLTTMSFRSLKCRQKNQNASSMLPGCPGDRGHRIGLLKEVIQPQVPLRLPCYDFTPVSDFAVGALPLAVGVTTSGAVKSHGVTGGVYKARERIHRGMLIRDY